MSKYIAVEDALNAMCDSCDAKHSICTHCPCKHYEAVECTPSADVFEVVACKDCVHLELLNSEHYYAQCNWHGRLFPRFGRPDTRYYFCADAVRREG